MIGLIGASKRTARSFYNVYIKSKCKEDIV